MMCYSIEPRDWIFVKSYGFLSFTKNVSTNIGKIVMIKPLGGWYSQTLLNHTKKSATDALKTALKRAI